MECQKCRKCKPIGDFPEGQKTCRQCRAKKRLARMNPMPKPSAMARFESKVSKSRGCWDWGGAIGKGGYGNFWDGTRYSRAHRFAWEAYFGTVGEGLYVCHHCDNPRCVNPAHLFLGTAKDNTQDAIRKGRLKPRGKPYTPKD